MIKVDIEEQFRKLQDILEDIKALLAWEQLKQEEKKSGQPPGFILHEPTKQDIREQFSRFLMVRLQIRTLLNNPIRSGISKARQAKYQQDIIHLEKQFHDLHLYERFIKF